jgi:hypothetical protein
LNGETKNGLVLSANQLGLDKSNNMDAYRRAGCASLIGELYVKLKLIVELIIFRFYGQVEVAGWLDK